MICWDFHKVLITLWCKFRCCQTTPSPLGSTSFTDLGCMYKLQVTLLSPLLLYSPHSFHGTASNSACSSREAAYVSATRATLPAPTQRVSLPRPHLPIDVPCPRRMHRARRRQHAPPGLLHTSLTPGHVFSPSLLPNHCTVLIIRRRS